MPSGPMPHPVRGQTAIEGLQMVLTPWSSRRLARFYIKSLSRCFVLSSVVYNSSRCFCIMEPTRANEKRLTSEKPSLYSTGSNDPPAYSDYVGTTTNGNNDEQLLARLGYKQVRSTPHISQTRRPLTFISRSSAASSTNGPQYPTPSPS